MNESYHVTDVLKSESRFTEAGSLPLPGPLGRLARLLLGVAILFWFVPELLRALASVPAARTLPTNPVFWFVVLITLVNTGHVVNLGLGRAWGRRPQIVVLALGAIALVASLVIYGRAWAPPLAAMTFGWLIVINLPLGVAFVLAALLGTPGCEMRSFNHLIARLAGKDPTEHFCPGGIDRIDHWEARRRLSQ